MKKHLAAAVLVVLAGAATAQAGVDFNVHIGVPVAVAAPPPTVVRYPYTAPAGSYPYAAPVGYVEEPGFIYSPRLGFYVSVGLPYDVVYVDNCYYRYRGGRWYMSPTYGGAWTHVSPRRLPYQLHRHHYDQIVHYRDREYRTYLHDRDHYRGRWYRPAAMHRHDRHDRHDRYDRYDRWDDRGYRDGRWDPDRDGYRDRDRNGRPDHFRDRR